MIEPIETVAKPSYLSLLEKRVAADARQTIVVQVCLAPELLAEREDARKALTQTRKRLAQRQTKAVTEAEQALADIEQQILDTTIHVTLRALSGKQVVIARQGVTDKTSMVEIIQRDLKEAFLSVTDGNGHEVVDIDAKQWARLLDVMPFMELQAWHGRLSLASGAPDFPTPAKP